MTTSEAEQKLQKLAELVRVMRLQQKFYFKFRSINYLNEARNYERKVDRFLEELSKPKTDKQQKITFGEG